MMDRLTFGACDRLSHCIVPISARPLSSQRGYPAANLREMNGIEVAEILRNPWQADQAIERRSVLIHLNSLDVISPDSH